MVNMGLIVVIAVVVLALAALAFGGFLLFRTLGAGRRKRAVVALIGRKEAIVASYRALWNIVERLAGATDEDLHRFSSDPRDEERRAFDEVASQMHIMEDQLKNTDVSRSLEGVVMTMEDAARLIFEAASTVNGGGESEPLVAASEIDFAIISDAVARMESELHQAAERNHVDDRSVYGGGLYI